MYLRLDGQTYRVQMVPDDEGNVTYVFEDGERHTCRDSECPDINEKATRELVGRA